ncbi:FbpB family small basic protein (plasmid) [Cytobacillus spongiae]|nr:FbpB family small basic protein [Cytobacillus spongiae]UII58300.1 FbpB family small basic protein [Cytobacillus spongiae]
MKKLKTSLTQLIEQNKNEILNDKKVMEGIEEKIDQKYSSAEEGFK